MKHIFKVFMMSLLVVGCTKKTESTSAPAADTSAQGQAASAAMDKDSQKNVVQIALGSKDHTTLVTAVKAAGLVDVLSNPGPFTVFAPVNAAFDKLPAGTVEGLLKPEKKSELADILQHHVYVGVLKEADLTEGRILNQVDSKNVAITHKNGKIYVDGAMVIASIPASNGYIHVIDGVLLPK